MNAISVAAIIDSMDFQYGSAGAMRSDNPSALFWQAWHDHKAWMKNFGFHVAKTRGGWCVFVRDPSAINLIIEAERNTT